MMDLYSDLLCCIKCKAFPTIKVEVFPSNLFIEMGRYFVKITLECECLIPFADEFIKFRREYSDEVHPRYLLEECNVDVKTITQYGLEITNRKFINKLLITDFAIKQWRARNKIYEHTTIK